MPCQVAACTGVAHQACFSRLTELLTDFWQHSLSDLFMGPRSHRSATETSMPSTPCPSYLADQSLQASTPGRLQLQASLPALQPGPASRACRELVFEKGFHSLREDKLQRYTQYARGRAAAAARGRGFRGAVGTACCHGLAAWRRAGRSLAQSRAVPWLLCGQVLPPAAAHLGCIGSGCWGPQ